MGNKTSIHVRCHNCEWIVPFKIYKKDFEKSKNTITKITHLECIHCKERFKNRYEDEDIYLAKV